MKFEQRNHIIDAAMLIRTHNRYALEQLLYFNINLMIFHEERTRNGESYDERQAARNNINFDLEQIRHCYMAMNRLDEGAGKHAEEEPTEVPYFFRSENFYPYINGIRASKNFLPVERRVEDPVPQPPQSPKDKCKLS